MNEPMGGPKCTMKVDWSKRTINATHARSLMEYQKQDIYPLIMKPGIISIIIGLYNALQLCSGNHLKNQHIDISQVSGAGFEASAPSHVKVTGIKFPKRSFTQGDKLTMEFRTAARNGLLFHAESHHKKHELSVWVQDGEIRLRISGRCHWLYVRDLAYDNYNVADNNFHKLMIIVKNTGVSFSIDHRDERTFHYAAHSTFRCWHIERFFFGSPSPNKIFNTDIQPEFVRNMNGCIKNFTTEGSAATDVELTASYKRVSSCGDL